MPFTPRPLPDLKNWCFFIARGNYELRVAEVGLEQIAGNLGGVILVREVRQQHVTHEGGFMLHEQVQRLPIGQMPLPSPNALL